MRICYVAMPYGVKRRDDGNPQDFEFFFNEGIKPTVANLDLECRRYDDFGPSAFWQKSMFTGIISSDVMIADISTRNPNVLYELGVRHALKRGRTILICAKGEVLPSNIGYSQILFYDLDPSGRPTGDALAKFRAELASVLQQSARSVISDSPIYEFFPDLETLLPPELTTEASTKLKQPVRRSSDQGARRAFAQAAVESPKQAVDSLKKSEGEVRSAPDNDPIAFLTLMRRYRDLSQWDSVIGLADDAPPSIKESPEVRQILALALNRRGRSGDQERAIKLMEQLIAETGGDGETFGILGRIYKDRYDKAKKANSPTEADENLRLALQHYRAGFEKNPKDIYPGINVVTLLQQRNDDEARAELESIVPKVRAAVDERIQAGRESGRIDYWDIATSLQLAVVAGDWTMAEQTAELAKTHGTASWMVESTLRDLEATSERLVGTERGRLDQIIGGLRSTQKAVGAL
jgi:tetratricopeptide (TPR) repeat protein